MIKLIFISGIFISILNTASVQGLCESPGFFGYGNVYEYSPAKFRVYSSEFNGTVGSDITLTLSSDLENFFVLDGEDVVVKDDTNITRADGNTNRDIEGTFICSGGTDKKTMTLQVRIYNNNEINLPKFSSNSYVVTVLESTVVGSEIVTVTATDEDLDPTSDDTSITYSIVDPTPYFTINDIGKITLAKSLDFENETNYILNISAKSTGYNSVGDLDSSQVIYTTVDINVEDTDDNGPQFQPCNLVGSVCVPPLYTTTVNRSELTTETLIIKPQPISAKDLDIGIVSTISYRIINDGSSEYITNFAIDPGTGSVTMIKEIGNDASVQQFNIPILAEESTGRSSFAYLQVTVVSKDEYPPVFSESSYAGYIAEDSIDAFSIVYADENRTIPLQLNVTDEDDLNAVFLFQITPPYQVSSDGLVLYQPSTASVYTTTDIEVKAINVNADLNSPNRESQTITIPVTIVTAPTTPEPTTAETTDTTAETTEATTTAPEATTTLTQDSTVTSEVTTVEVTSVQTTDSIADTTEGTTTATQPTTDTTESLATTPVTSSPVSDTTVSTETMETSNSVSTVTSAGTDAIDTTVGNTSPTAASSTTVAIDSTTVSSSTPISTFSDTSTATLNSETNSVSATSTLSEVTTVTTTDRPDSTANVITDSTIDTGSTKTTTKASVDKTESTDPTTSGTVGVIPVGYVADTVLYGVAGGLSGALLICILIIVYLLCKKKKPKDIEKDDASSIGRRSSINSNAIANPAFVNEVDDDNVSRASSGRMSVDAASQTNLSDAKEDKIQENDSGTEVHDFEEKDSVPDEEPLQVEDPIEDEPESSFANEIKRGAAALAAATTVAAVYDYATDEPEPKPVAIDDNEDGTQTYGSAYKKSQVHVDTILKDGTYGQTRLVTVEKYGVEKEDIKVVVKTLRVAEAPYSDLSSIQAQIRLMERACEQEHENILQYCGMHEDSNELHCAMMYAPNGSLENYLNGNSNLSPRKMLSIMSGIGAGLQYLHARNIVHCHLQSRCVMLDSDLTPKIRDYENNEVSSIKENDNRLRWQALEILNGALSDSASDIWSYGVVMWEIASRNATPYEGISDDDLLGYLMDNNRLGRPRGCSESIFSMMESCWNADSRFRPDMYVLMGNLSEKLMQDPSELFGVDVDDQGSPSSIDAEQIDLSFSHQSRSEEVTSF